MIATGAPPSMTDDNDNSNASPVDALRRYVPLAIWAMVIPGLPRWPRYDPARDELHAFDAVQADVPESVRNRLFAEETHHGNVIKQLWESILSKLGLQYAALHPEELLDSFARRILTPGSR